MKKHLVYAYLFSLFLIATIGMVFCCGFCLYIFIRDGYSFAEFWPGYLIVILLLVGYFVACVYEGYTFLGFAKFTSNAIILCAPLRKRIVMQYADISAIGIDYGVVNGQPQFWIYASRGPMPKNCWGKLTKMRISSSFIRIAYSPRVFDDLQQTLPPDLQEELLKGKTILDRVK